MSWFSGKAAGSGLTAKHQKNFTTTSTFYHHCREQKVIEFEVIKIKKMHFEVGEVYHVYNRGNEKQKIFFSDDNYLYFLRKVELEWLPYCDVICYCLMPNHFHFMLAPKPSGCEYVVIKNKPSDLQVFSKVIGKTLSSYTWAINKHFNRTGNLFQKKTKSKCLTNSADNYLVTCFDYIHFNPEAAGIVKDPRHWKYSSLNQLIHPDRETICNRELVKKFVGSQINLRPYSNQDSLNRIW